MDVNGQALTPRPVAHPGLDGARAQPPAVARHEQGSLVGFCELAAVLQPAGDGFAGQAADRHDPRLAALAGDADQLFGEVDIA